MKPKWLLPLGCFILTFISMLPPYTEIAHDPQNTQDVIASILSVSLQPYQDWGWFFHITTILLILLILWKPQRAGRALPAYIGLNYLLIAALQTHAITDQYGLAIQTGALVGTLLIGIIWLIVSFRGNLHVSPHNFRKWHYALLPLVLLAFLVPVKMTGEVIMPNFDLKLLLTSVDYGLTYCFVTPVFLFFLIVFTTDYTGAAFRLSSFNGFLYGLFNLTHWSNSTTAWMGVMHLPLLINSLLALLLPYLKSSTTKAVPSVRVLPT